jgi:hypothetical protein
MYVFKVQPQSQKNNAFIVYKDNIRSYIGEPTKTTLKQLKNSTNTIVAFTASSSNTFLVVSIKDTNKTTFEYSKDSKLSPLDYSFCVDHTHNGTG